MTPRSFPYWNDLRSQPCFILREEPRQDLIDVGIEPIGHYVIVENEDGTKDKLFPWELTLCQK